MNIDPESYDEIAQLIDSDSSPVGIDARKTHILIIHMLQQLTQRLNRLEQQIDALSRS